MNTLSHSIDRGSALSSWPCPSQWLLASSLLLALLLPLPALAWNAAGHRLVACIAWDDLAPDQRAALAQLLREHPDHERWDKRSADGDAGRAAFIEASTWPDEIRKDSRFYSAGSEAPTATLPGFPDMERRGSWHSLKRPLSAPPETLPLERSGILSGQLDRQLVAQAQTLGSTDAPRSERSYALPWLIHLVGEAHQPLHTSVKIDAQGGLDKLGTKRQVFNPFNPRKSATTLHAYWDDLPGPSGLRGDRLDAACRTLSAATPRPAPSTSGQWLDESWEIARRSAYPPGDEKVATISEQFDEDSRQIANRRIAEAGFRLADLLRGLLGGKLND
jgi:hypothetical protein